jgi:crotonobetainyl-CoA:carnitine CoA-transferase CaiB-like acyl-CoA transferase
MLEGLNVLEVSRTVSGSAAGAMFRDLGATVRKAGSPHVPGTEWRNRSPGRQEARLCQVLDYGKTPTRGAIENLVADADVTVLDLGGYRFVGSAGVTAYLRWVERINCGVWASISPYGLDGSRATTHGGELSATAAGGIAWYMRSSLGRPMKPAGFGASMVSGHFAVLAALHGLMLRRSGHGTTHLDVSGQDSVILTGVFMQCGNSLLHAVQQQSGPPGAQEQLHIVPRQLVHCADRYLVVIVLEDHQWLKLLSVLGNPSWAEGIFTTADRASIADRVQSAMGEWAQHRSASECAAILQAAGVPAAPVNSPADLLADEGLRVRGFFAAGTERPGEQIPGVPGVLSPVSRIEQDGEVVPSRPAAFDFTTPLPRRPRLLDLSHVLAGPLATSWLGAMGIDVLRVEDPTRTDVYRRIGPFPKGVRHQETSVRFASANHSKRSYAIDLDNASGRERLSRLISSADLVVENLSQDRAVGLGLTVADFATYPGVALLSSSGFGRRSPLSAYRAYGFNIHAFGGIVHLSRDRTGQPRNLGTSWADPLASSWLAVIAAAQALRPPGQRDHFDLSMVEAVARQLPEFFSLLSGDGLDLVASESRLEGMAPHGIFQCSGTERWVALAISGDDEWHALLDALGHPDVLAAEPFATQAGRESSQPMLEEALESVLRHRDRDELVDLLQRKDLDCAPVLSGEELVADPRLWQRGLFHSVQHPVAGDGGLTGLPWRIVETGPIPIGRTPLLGEHTSDDPTQWWLK